jgi:hypothetical protein
MGQHLIANSTEARIKCSHVILTNIPLQFREANNRRVLNDDILSSFQEIGLVPDSTDLARIEEPNFLSLTYLGTGSVILKLKDPIIVGIGACEQTNIIYNANKRARKSGGQYTPSWKPYMTLMREGTEAWLNTSTFFMCTGAGSYKQTEQDAARITLASAIKKLNIDEFFIFSHSLLHSERGKDYSEPILVVMIREKLSDKDRYNKLAELFPSNRWVDGSTITVNNWNFQIFGSIGSIRKIKPNMTMHGLTVKHITLSGIQPTAQKQQILSLVSQVVHPKHIAYIYHKKTSHVGSFTMALFDSAPTLTATDWDGLFPKPLLIANGPKDGLTISSGECLPTRNEIEWYKHNKTDDKILNHSIITVSGARGRGNGGRGSVRGIVSYKDTLRADSSHSSSSSSSQGATKISKLESTDNTKPVRK